MSDTISRKMSKEYHINTMQDVIDCVNEDNINNFMIDFKNYVTAAIAIKKIDNIIADKHNVSMSKLLTDGFIWIDDGKHDLIQEIFAD